MGTIQNLNNMYKRVFVFFCFNLFLIGSVYCQQPNQVVVVTKPDGSEDLSAVCAEFDEILKEIKLSSESQFNYIVFKLTKPESNEEILASWIVPIEFINDYQQIEVILNVESDMNLPDELYDIHLIGNLDDELSDANLRFRFNKQTDE